MVKATDLTNNEEVNLEESEIKGLKQAISGLAKEVEELKETSSKNFGTYNDNFRKINSRVSSVESSPKVLSDDGDEDEDEDKGIFKKLRSKGKKLLGDGVCSKGDGNKKCCLPCLGSNEEDEE